MNKPKFWFFLFAFLFILANALFTLNDILWFNLLPLVFIIVGIAFFALDKLLLLIVFFTPLSLNFEKLEFGLGIALPTEPLMAGAMLLFFIKIIKENSFDKKLLYHPISIAIIIYLSWMFITFMTSQMPVTSFKFFLSRLWFIVSFFFLGTHLFKEIKNIKYFFWLFIIPLFAVMVYTIIQHSKFNFDPKPAHWVMDPFFKDHTSYGAVLAMFYPFLIMSMLNKKISFETRILIAILTTVYTVGLILSYTRAAWVSLVGALVVYVIMYFRVRWWVIGSGIVVAILLFFSLRTDIIMKLEKNRQDAKGDFTEHLQSISNVATDASNLERLNRWTCAWEMFKEKPIFGWGPGTYVFQYAPFQHSRNITVISTNFGDNGNAHSEFLGPLAEQGLFGLLTFLSLVLLTCYHALEVYPRIKNDEVRALMTCAFLGLVTYYIHGLLNNYLDLDKAAVPFWAFTAIVVVVDVYHSDKAEAE